MPYVLEKPLNGHDLARRAVAALESILLHERLLYGPEFLTLHEPFEGRDFRSLGLEQEYLDRVIANKKGAVGKARMLIKVLLGMRQ
jgi:hypothetical protein